MTIDFPQILGALVIAFVLNAVSSIIAFMIFRAQTSIYHAQNQVRLIKIERALGIEDPDETAFVRANDHGKEHERIWNEFGEHDGRIRSLESPHKR